MNRPAVKNAIGKNFLNQLEASIASLKHSDARVVILRSLVDKTFCAGADLKVRQGRKMINCDQVLKTDPILTQFSLFFTPVF